MGKKLSYNELQKKVRDLEAEIKMLRENNVPVKPNNKEDKASFRQSENRFRDLFVSSREGILVADTKRNIIDANPFLEKMFGYKPGEMPGKKTSCLYAKDQDYREIGLQLKNHEKDNGFFKIITYKTKKGTQFIGETNIFYLRDTKGKITGYVGLIRDVTETIKTNQALKESEKKYHDFVNLLPEIVFEIDEQSTFLFLNEYSLNVLGYTKKDLQKRRLTLDMVIHPDDLDRLKMNVAKVLKGSQIMGNYYRVLTADKNELTIQAFNNPVFKENKTAGIRGIAINVTEKLKTEQALKESEEKYRNIVEMSPDGIITATLQGKIKSVNESFIQLTGYEKRDFENKHLTGIPTLLKADMPIYLKLIRGIVTKKVADVSEFRWKHKNGEIRIGEARVKIMKKNRIPVGFQAIVRDITDRRRVEDAINQRNDELAAINAISTAVSKSLNIKKILNTALKKSIAVLKADAGLIYLLDEREMTFYPSVHINISKKLLNEVSNFKKGQGISGFAAEKEEPVMIPDLAKSKRNLAKSITSDNLRSLASVPVKIRGKVTAVMTLVTKKLNHFDKEHVHLLKRIGMQIGIALDNAALYQQVQQDLAEREKTNKELIKAKEKAEESDRLKSAFLANMSHEIRTPMNGIIGFSEILQEETLTGEKRKSYTQIVMNSGQQLLNIVNDILDISKIETGQVKINNNKVILNQMMLELFTFFKPKINTQEVSLYLHKDAGDEESTIHTDKARLSQVFNNLLSNAVKFTQKGHIKFGYEIKTDEVLFFVEDTGIGIPAKYHDSIFERFRQADMDLSRKYGGTGLGLSISKGLVELMNGRLWLESKQGKGSTFYFTIPYQEKPEKEKNTRTEEDIAETDENISNTTILLVEDEEINHLYFEEVLSSHNINLLQAYNGKEAVEICTEHPEIQLVIMDIKMPEMDGFEATRNIKKYRPDLPVIAITAYAMAEDRQKALKAGCDDYLSKPVKYKTLLKRIAELIKQH